MLLRSIKEPLIVIKGIGTALLPKLAKLGISKVSDLLSYYPRHWEDRSVFVPIKDFQKGPVCTEVTVLAKEWIGFRRMVGRNKPILKVYVEDESARAALFCFNRPWLEKQLENGKTYRLYGRFYLRNREIQAGSFEIEPVNNDKPVIPVYSLCAGITQVMLRRFISRAIEKFANDLDDELPQNIIERDKLLSKTRAIRAIHFPSSSAEMELAKKTLIYEELFYLEIMVGKRALARKGKRVRSEELGVRDEELGGRSEGVFSPLQKGLVERLPFSLTEGQQKAIAEINADMAG